MTETLFMPNRNTPPKHMTQNYKLVTRSRRDWEPRKNGWVTFSWSKWEPIPLRVDRKDIPRAPVAAAPALANVARPRRMSPLLTAMLLAGAMAGSMR
jgi:hypothetical protein